MNALFLYLSIALILGLVIVIDDGQEEISAGDRAAFLFLVACFWLPALFWNPHEGQD